MIQVPIAEQNMIDAPIRFYIRRMEPKKCRFLLHKANFQWQINWYLKSSVANSNDFFSNLDPTKRLGSEPLNKKIENF